MYTPAKALDAILRHSKRQPVETVLLDGAAGRVLARDVRADRDMPPADRSAMDGYAVRAADLAEVPRELHLAGEVAAGSDRRPRVRSGCCVRILTGANIPPGADAVAVVESTTEIEPDVIAFRSSVAKGANIFRRGENARKGDVVLTKGTRLDPQRIGLCAAIGKDPVPVYEQPRVGVLCSGRELVAASDRAPRHAQRDSNGPTLRAALQASGLARCTIGGVVDDAPRAIRLRIEEALDRCDVLILVGGMSVGKYDLVPSTLEAIGCRKVFHKVKMKPGKPFLFALGPDKQLIFGLPGNPLAALVGFHEFVRPALEKMAGLEERRPATIQVRLGEPLAIRSGGRMRFHPARLNFESSNGTLVAVPLGTRSSADVVAGGQCDGVLILPENKKDFARGSRLAFHPWRVVL